MSEVKKQTPEQELVEKIKQALIEKHIDSQHKDEIEFLLKRL